MGHCHPRSRFGFVCAVCKGAVGGGESDSGGIGVELVEARRPVEVMERRRADRGGGDVRSGGGAEAAEAQKRRTRRTHCGRPCDSPDARGHCHPRSRFGFVCVVWTGGHRRGR